MKKHNLISFYNRAIQWIKNNTIPEQGIVVSSKRKIPYLEVTGYLIPTLINIGEYNLADQYTEFLSYMQRPNGSFSGPDGETYVFDTAQALRGLLRASEYWDKFKPFAIKAAEYLFYSIKENGQIPSKYHGTIPESVHIFILPVLKMASEVLKMPEYLEAAQKSLLYYKNSSNFESNQLTHFLAYAIDGLIDMGESKFVRPFVQNLFKSQKKNGALPAFSNVNWVCSVGVAQFAIIGYKLGMKKEADKALDYLCGVQNPSGGFNGSYGRSSKYFSNEEISWANKFFIDAAYFKIHDFFNRFANIFPKEVSKTDGRLETVLTSFGNLANKKILDVGCGKGRFSARIKEAYPTCEIHGIDISDKLLKEVPDSIITRKGSILNIDYNDETFDGIFCIEVLEHAMAIKKAIEEMCRVLKNMGKIIIIDKNIQKLGRLEITDFEQWFNKNEIKSILEQFCSDVQVTEIKYNNHEADGLFLAWSGIKGLHILDNKEWHKVMIGEGDISSLVKDIKNNKFPFWIKPLLKCSAPEESLLELGSGTGELSAILGIYNRIPHLLDYSKENLEFVKSLFNELKLHGHFYLENILDGLSLEANTIDWVWSSGLLEHFSDEEILYILKESVRVCKKGVMCLVPNANSIFYRIGKFKMEQEGKWPYGKEIPKFTMKHYFKEVGLRNIIEYSVGPYHSINFLKNIRKDAEFFYNSLNLKEIQDLNQGYLLFTYGEK